MGAGIPEISGTDSDTGLEALLAVDPSKLTVAQARSLVSKLEDSNFKRRRLFYEGDHFQNGEGLSSLIPEPNHVSYASVKKRLGNAFVSQNVIREICKRHQSAVCGQLPQFGLASLVVEEDEDDEARRKREQALEEYMEPVRTWWRDCAIHEIMGEAVRAALFGKKAVLRLRIAQTVTRQTADGEEETGVAVERGSLQSALAIIRLEYVPQDEAAVWEDGGSLTPRAVFAYRTNRQDRAEVQYLDEDGQVVIRQLGGGNDEDAAPLSIDGQIMMYQLTVESLITDQVEQLQKLLNKALTMLSTNLDWSAFIERILLNAQPEGKLVKNEQGHDFFKPEPPKVGPGITSYVSGLPKKDKATGEIVGYETPEVVFRDPIDVKTFRDSKQEAYENILKEVQQVHVLIVGDAQTSGESRRQAMSDFLISLLITKPAVDRLGRWLLKTVLALASTISGTELPESRTVFQCRVNPGPMPASQMALIIKQVAASLLSQETAMGDLGVEDVEAELDRIAEERGIDLDTSEKQAMIYQTHRLAGTSIRLAGEFAGYEEDVIEALLKAEFATDD